MFHAKKGQLRRNSHQTRTKFAPISDEFRTNECLGQVCEYKRFFFSLKLNKVDEYNVSSRATARVKK